MNAYSGLRKSLTAAGLCLLAVAGVALPGSPASRRARAKGPVLQVSHPVSYKNLTLFPIRASGARSTDDYITLDEGIKNGTIVITEKGSTQPTARRVLDHRGNQRVVMRESSGASVNELALINRSGKKLLLLAGEVIVGGKQDRIVEEDLIVPPISVPVSLSVFCVEHGRWQHRAARASGSSNMQSNRIARREVVVGGQDAPDKFSTLGAISHPKLRAAAQDTKQQSEVWKEVTANNARLGTSNTTDTYQEVYQNAQVGATMEQYLSALERELTGPGIVGVVVARNGELVWIDRFASPALFAKYWPKLLKSYVIDALGEQLTDKRPTVEQAQRYLTEGGGRISAKTREGVYRLYKTETPRYATFHLEDISLSAPVLLHFNKMER
ncbi:MAG TPA: DUF6569 family protein [Pyrinomonadaceae bacterium]|jgi:hypothetical protein|nr:DUF6569 family protein [Pyrinomonadaceae bacterium]